MPIELLLLAALGASVAAAAVDLPWSTLQSGGGRSSGSSGTTTYAVTGTVGQFQAYAGGASGGAFAQRGGYWAVVIPSDGSPALSIARAGTDVVVNWGANAIGYQLQYSADLTVWTDYAATITGAASINWPLHLGPRYFFRLRKLDAVLVP